MIESAKLLPGLTDAMRDTLSITSTIFDDTIPTMHRVLFLGGSKTACAIALDWDPCSVAGTAASWFTLTPSSKDVKFACFLELASVFTDSVENLISEVQCPILRSTLNLYASVCLDNSEAWAQRLLEAAIGARHGLPANMDPPSHWPRSHQARGKRSRQYRRTFRS